MISTKTCSKCNKEKPFSEFNKRKRSKDGYYVWCKDCAKEYQSQWYKKNKERVDEQHRKYHREHREERLVHLKEYRSRPEVKAHRRQYAKDNYEHIKEYHREYRKNNREHIRKRQREYYHNNKDKAKVWRDKYKSTHKEQIKQSAKRYREENRVQINERAIQRLHNDPVHNMKERVRNMVRYALRVKGHRKNSKTQDIVGCNLNDLWGHLTATWKNNYGTEWNGEEYHIDHIIPLATAKTEEDVIRLCHYTNLQMLTPSDNQEKSDKI